MVDEVRKMVAAKARGGLDKAVFARFQDRLHYLRGDLDQAETFESLSDCCPTRPFSCRCRVLSLHQSIGFRHRCRTTLPR